jgi:hypothetical protein
MPLVPASIPSFLFLPVLLSAPEYSAEFVYFFDFDAFELVAILFLSASAGSDM